jgi:hypothetical protein
MDLRSVAMELLDRSRLSSGDVAEAVARATDRGYWEALRGDAPSPGLRPPSPASGRGTSNLDPRELPLPLAGEGPRSGGEGVANALHTNGYFALDSLLARPTIDGIRDLIERVRAAGWPAVFAFMYDEPWLLYRSDALRAIARDAIGEDVAQSAYFWGHFVPAVAGARGWTPHADANEVDEPRRVTVWIAITDATLDNGCMYVIPRPRMTRETLEAFFDREAGFDRSTTLGLLQSARALPARAGSILGWEFRTVHWGSVCHATGGTPRISISAEYTSRAALVARGEEVLPLDELPDFATRVRLIGRAMKTYVHWDMQLTRFDEVYRALSEWEG